MLLYLCLAGAASLQPNAKASEQVQVGGLFLDILLVHWGTALCN